MSRRNIYLGVPLGGASLGFGTHRSIVDGLTSRHSVLLGHQVSSILPFTFNSLWCNALNKRHEMSLTHFVMLHSDVSPVRGWMDLLVDLFDEHQLDVLSVVVPLKSHVSLVAGLTSTAVDTHPWRPRRFSTTEIAGFSRDETVGDSPLVLRNDFFLKRYGANLLFNTGLMCLRLDRDWSTDVCFDFRNRVVLDQSGQYYPQVEPEDWRFSRWCHARGLRVAVTSSIQLGHNGYATFQNNDVWGQPVDSVNIDHAARDQAVPVVEVAGGQGAVVTGGQHAVGES